MRKQVTVIPATKEASPGAPKPVLKKKRVAAYARVSTDSDEQLTSYDAQVDYYTNYIKAKPEWELAGIYTDEGISGVMTKRREGFNSMIEDALAGKIDLIITKSVSRFARNTVDSLTTIRKLKEKGVGVYYEKENINTLDSEGELLLTLMSSLAQEESRSLSQNVTWGHRKRFSDGHVTFAYKHFLGYRRGPDGTPEIDPKEAPIVRRIYKEFMQGLTLHQITKGLTDDHIKTPRGKDVWHRSTVESILKNEKYKGDALLQKSFTIDYLTKKTKINEGEVPQYYVTGSHPAIIEPKEWDMVQVEMARRKENNDHSSYLYGNKLACAECGKSYGRKIWHSNDKYRREVWRCNGKYENGGICTTPAVKDDDVQRLFIEAMRRYLDEKEYILKNVKTLKENCLETAPLEAQIEDVIREMEITEKSIKQCIEDNASAAISQEEYRKRYDHLYDRFQELEEKKANLESKLSKVQIEIASMEELIACLENLEKTPLEFDPMLWRILVDKALVTSSDTIRFIMAGGREYEFDIY